MNHIRRRRQQIGQAAERHRAFVAQDLSLSASRWCSIEPAVRRCRTHKSCSAFALPTVSKSPTSLRTSYSCRGRGKAQGSRARASLAVVVVFFIVFSSGKLRRGGHRRPSSFRLRRAGFLLAPVDGAVGSDESVGTEPAVGGRRLLVLYRIEIPATELKICGRRTGSVL